MSGACVIGHEERTEALDGLLVCSYHRRRMDDHVTEIGLLIVDAQRIRDGGAPSDGGPKGKAPKKRADPPAPGDVTLMVLFDPRSKPSPPRQSYPRNWNATAGRFESNGSEGLVDVLSIVSSWLLLLAEERPLTSTLPHSVLAQLDLLKRHHEWIAAQLWVDDYLLELGEVRKALATAVRDHRFTRRGRCPLSVEEKAVCACYCHVNGSATCNVNKNKPGEVPYCGPHEFVARPCNGTLLEENGTAVVHCTGCKARWVTDQELARLAVSLESA